MKIDVKLTKGAGALDAWLVIDNIDVATNAAGKGSCDIDANTPRHTFVIWLEGPSGSTCEFEFRRDGHSLAEGKLTVSNGNWSQVLSDGFSHA